MRRKTAAQLDRDIAEALAGRRQRSAHSTRGPYGVFSELIRQEDPAGMEVAQDALLEGGWKMREVTGGMRARNFTIELKSMWGPREEWKMVQTSIEALTSKPGIVWVKWSAANGRARAEKQREYKGGVDDVKQMAVATAWAIAKAIKSLPMDAGDKALKQIVDKAVARGKKNVVPEELF
jgi:hypothetical protein